MSFLKILECEKTQTEYFHVCIFRFSAITKSDGSVFLFFFFFNLQLLKKANIFYYFQYIEILFFNQLQSETKPNILNFKYF